MKIIKSNWIDELEGENLSVYSEDGRDMLVDDDEMTLEEAGFMQGWDEAG